MRQNAGVGDASTTAWIMARARELGFDLCGVARAEEFPELLRMSEWLELGYAGEMRYLEDSRRRSLESVLPGARSIVVCALNYNTPQRVAAAAGGYEVAAREFDVTTGLWSAVVARPVAQVP